MNVLGIMISDPVPEFVVSGLCVPGFGVPGFRVWAWCSSDWFLRSRCSRDWAR